MSPVDVVLCELEAIAEGVVNVGLCSEMHDSVDVFSDEQVVHQICTSDVSFHELEIVGGLGRHQIVQVGTVV